MPKGFFVPLTAQNEKQIRAEYLTKPIKVLADELGTTYGVIMRRLNKWGLEISETIRDKNRAEGRFYKLNIPHNKGKKQSDYMSPEAIDRTKSTRFKTGHNPHNTNPEGNGAIVIRKESGGIEYKYIRISVGVWELYHRFLWEQQSGNIPTGYVVTFKDQNSLNVTIENLKVISRSENMLRNSIHMFTKEIVPSMALIRQLETKLNHLQNA